MHRNIEQFCFYSIVVFEKKKFENLCNTPHTLCSIHRIQIHDKTQLADLIFTRGFIR